MQNEISTTQKVDIIEKIVYARVKPLGFRKHGRTLHRFVDGDISQVINFQNGCPQKGVLGVLWINVGVRVPECAERTFFPEQGARKFYRESECNLRFRLGELAHEENDGYDLAGDAEEIGNDAAEKTMELVLPIFEKTRSREAYLEYKGEGGTYFLLEKAMIYGRRGEAEKATEIFNAYYRACWDNYIEQSLKGHKRRFRKGESYTYFNRKTNMMETIVGQSNAQVRIYNASTGHLEYLEKIAENLGIPLDKSYCT